MCGLAGFARKPGPDGFEKSVAVFEKLLAAMETRGRHATGVAVDHGDSVLLWKKAVQARKVLESDAWNDEVVSRLMPSARYVIGHTRHATQNNAHIDECAHPFVHGRVVGAHNGMIYNWRELEAKFRPVDDQPWDVDSQAAISMLSTHGIRETLDTLDGYWALTWIENGKLYAVRTPEAPLAMAYVPSLGTMFWASLRSSLVDVLKRAGFSKDDCDVFELNASTLYVFDVNDFGPKGTNRRARVVTFNGRKRTASQSELFATSGARGRGRGRSWTTTSRDAGKGKGADKPQWLTDRVDRLERITKTLIDRLAEVDADVSFLFKELDLDEYDQSASDETFDSLDRELEDVEDDDELRCDVDDEDDEIVVVRNGEIMPEDDDSEACYRCERGRLPGNPLLRLGLEGGETKFVHAQCVFTGKPA